MPQAMQHLSVLYNDLILLTIPGYLQNGRVRNEDARRRVDAREANRQNIPTNGQKQRRETVPRGVHRGRQERPVHRAPAAVRSAVTVIPYLLDLSTS